MEQNPETAKRRAEAGRGEGEWDDHTHPPTMSGLRCLLNCPELINCPGQGAQDFWNRSSHIAICSYA